MFQNVEQLGTDRHRSPLLRANAFAHPRNDLYGSCSEKAYTRNRRLRTGTNIGRGTRNRPCGRQPPQKGAPLYPPHLDPSAHIGIVPVVAHAVGNYRRYQRFNGAPSMVIESGNRCTGAIIVSNLQEANQQKRVSLSPSDAGCGHRSSRQRSPRAARVALERSAGADSVLTTTPAELPVEKAASLTDLLLNLHLLLRSADVLPSAGFSF